MIKRSNDLDDFLFIGYYILALVYLSVNSYSFRQTYNFHLFILPTNPQFAMFTLPKGINMPLRAQCKSMKSSTTNINTLMSLHINHNFRSLLILIHAMTQSPVGPVSPGV